jgi:hypothetical protein
VRALREHLEHANHQMTISARLKEEGHAMYSFADMGV